LCLAKIESAPFAEQIGGVQSVNFEICASPKLKAPFAERIREGFDCRQNCDCESLRLQERIAAFNERRATNAIRIRYEQTS